SVSLPVSYARRTENWSFLVEGAVSRSFARSARGDSNRGSATGYRVGGVVERRLNKHWVLGGAIDYRRSKDYSPSHFMLYLRYAFEPWQGPLPMRPEPMIPYAEFK
ncbi:MAG TPA: cellulose synthase subunit BcsC-related outer membrane protein, partial [Burkholderiaceae bacterium]|nr:cellulose synthase subunit BcsC-related outer membrane protein [Burkholderiaceae bacterium]